MLGRIAVANRTIFIDRLSTTKGVSVTDQIVDRLKTHDGAKVGMFPEGTTSNGTSIVNFRSGAFVAGAPVVPVVFKYPYRFFDPVFSSVSLKVRRREERSDELRQRACLTLLYMMN